MHDILLNMITKKYEIVRGWAIAGGVKFVAPLLLYWGCSKVSFITNI